MAPGAPSPDAGSEPGRAVISVVVPVYDAMPHLPRCVEALIRAARASGRRDDLELIFVDNGSTDGSMGYLEDRLGDLAGGWSGRIAILELADGNVGAVRNHGAARASGDFLSFVDADCVVSDDYFDRALDVLDRTEADATGSRYALPEDPAWVERVWFRLHDRNADGFTNYLPAGNLFLWRAAFEAVGGFDEDLESGEDAELAQRVWAGGFTMYEAASVRAVHLGNPKSIAHHFGKQRWHGKGALGTARRDLLDKPLLMTITHWILLLASLAWLLLHPSWAGVALGTAAWILIPALTVGYRMLQVRRIVDPLRGILLYWIYFGARGIALAETVLEEVRTAPDAVA